MRELLRRFYRHPIHSAFEDYLKALPGRQRVSLTESTVSFTALESCLSCARELVFLSALDTPSLSPSFRNELSALREDLQTSESRLSEALQAEAEGNREEAVRKRMKAQSAVSSLSSRIGALLEPHWRLSSVGPLTPNNATTRRAFRLAQLFVVGRLVEFLREIFPHFRSMMFHTTLAILLALLALSSYPFAQRDTLIMLAWIIVVAAAGTTIYVLVTMNRDRVLSLLSGTVPGQISWNGAFVAQLFTVMLPVLGLLGVQFPGEFASILSWLSKAGGHLG